MTHGVDVSPDGTRLVVSSERSGNPELWVLPSEGGEMLQLTTERTPDWFPRWSPDGQQVAFYSYWNGNRDLRVLPSRGGAARQLTTYEGTDRYPTWAPNGTEIFFKSSGLASATYGLCHSIQGSSGHWFKAQRWTYYPCRRRMGSGWSFGQIVRDRTRSGRFRPTGERPSS